MVHIQRMVLSPQFLRRLAVAVGAVALVLVGLWLLLPGWMARQIEDRATQALGRAVTVRSVEVAPWSLAVTINGLQVAGLPGQVPAVAVERTYINASITSLLRWALVLDAVELDQPVVRVRQEASGQWDFADVLHKLQQGADPQRADDAPVRVALYNIQIRDGLIELDDQAAGVQHKVEDVQLQLPFISTLPSQREVKVQPRLSMRVNGSEIASQAVATPFDATHAGQAKLELQHLDLAPYVPYLPASLPVRLRQGWLDAEIRVAFEQKDQAVVQLQGSNVQLSDVKLQDAEGLPLASWSRLTLALGDTRPLQRQVRVAQVVLDQPFGHLYRREGGHILPSTVTPAGAAQPAPVTGDSKKIAAEASWVTVIDQLDVHGGGLQWRDELERVGAKVLVDQVNLRAHNLAWPMGQDARWQLEAQLQSPDRVARGSLRSVGTGDLENGQTTLTVDQLDLQVVQAYANQWLRQPLGGLASLNADVTWQQGRVRAQVPLLTLESVAMGAAKSPEVSWTQLQLKNLQLDAEQQQVLVEHVALAAPFVRVQRNPQGRWMYEQWLAPRTGSSAKGAQAVRTSSAQPWQMRAQAVDVKAGQVEVSDAALDGRPLAVKLTDVQLRLQDVDSLKGTAQVELSVRLAERTRRGGWGRPGSMSYAGVVQLDPLLTRGRLRLSALPVQAFEPYVAPWLNVRLVQALASFDGEVQYALRAKGAQLSLQGQGQISEVQVRSLAGDEKAAQMVQGPQASAALIQEDLLSWKQLRLQGIRVNMQPEQVPHIQVRSTELNDFYARIVVLPEGRLNLQNLIKPAPQAEAESGSPPGATAQTPVVAEAEAKPSARIDMGPIALRNGVIKFSDYFIQPNYTADLTHLEGGLEAFSSQPAAPGEAPALAKLSLKGTAQGTAQLDIEGAINPLAKPLALDVRAQMEGLDLPPLSPYAIKYVGHGIEKGKLSMDVHYQVQPDGQLTATNQLVLNQLTFSEPVQGAPASLPVRLAVALLADSNGVIDLNLPISGSLNDPQFRLAPVIFKILGNIIRKAVTAPFSLLTGAFASADEQSGIHFEPGRAQLTAQAKEQLQQLAKAMENKPQLQLTLEGQTDRATEAQGWKQAKLAQLVQGPSEADAADAGAAPVRTEKEQLAALKRVYRATVKDRERNLLGLTKDVPPEEMRALIEKNMVIPENAWQELAAARAQNVRNYLLEQGVDAKRVFLGNAKDKASQPPSPAVLLNISVQ